MAGEELTASVYSSSAVAISIYYSDTASTLQSITVETNMTSEGSNRYSYTFTIPDVTIAAFGEDTGLLVRFHYANAANPLPNDSYDIWNVQLEPGPVATPFEHRPIGTELALCQRYYQYLSRMFLYPIRPHMDDAQGSSCARTVEMRVNPTQGIESSPHVEGARHAGDKNVWIIQANGPIANPANNLMLVDGLTADAEL